MFIRDSEGKDWVGLRGIANYDPAGKLSLSITGMSLKWGQDFLQQDFSSIIEIVHKIMPHLGRNFQKLLKFVTNIDRNVQFHENGSDISELPKGTAIQIVARCDGMLDLVRAASMLLIKRSRPKGPLIEAVIHFKYAQVHENPSSESGVYGKMFTFVIDEPTGVWSWPDWTGWTQSGNRDDKSDTAILDQGDTELVWYFVPVGDVDRAFRAQDATLHAKTNFVISFCDHKIAVDQASPIKPRVFLDQLALFRHGTESLFGFTLDPIDSKAAYSQLRRVRVTITLPIPLGKDLAREGLFGVSQIDRPRPNRDVAIISPCPVVSDDRVQIGATKINIEYSLSSDVEYCLTLNLDRINFLAEKLFWVRYDDTIPAAIRISIDDITDKETEAKDYARRGRSMIEVDLEMQLNTQTAFLLISNRVEYALVLHDALGFDYGPKDDPNREATNLAEIDIYFDRIDLDGLAIPSEESSIALQAVNLGPKDLEISFLGREAQIPAFENQTSSIIRLYSTATFQLPIHRNSSEMGIDVRWRSIEGNPSHMFGRKVRFIAHNSNAKFVALDIGTTAISASYETRGTTGIRTAELGGVLERSPSDEMGDPADSSVRRERKFRKLLSVATGITLADAKIYPVPIQVAKGIDPRLLAQPFVRDETRRGPEHRLRLTKTSVDINLPYWIREDVPSTPWQRGLFLLASIKSQICNGEFADFGPSQTGMQVLYAFRGAGDESAALQPTGVGRVETTCILAAIIDSLLNGYLPAAGAFEQNDKGEPQEQFFILTFPASIGETARNRYKSALEDVLDAMTAKRMRLAAAREISYGENLDHHRPDSDYISEAFAAAWAILERPDEIWTASALQSRKIKRLVLFDIGGGTMDVAAFDLRVAEAVVPIQQTVSFSLPVAGNLLDEAIGRDLTAEEVWPAYGSDAWRAILDRVDIGKRCMAGGLLRIPDSANFAPGEPEYPVTGDQRYVADEGTIEDIPSLSGRMRVEKPMVWTEFDFNERLWTKKLKNLRDYLDLVEKVIVPSVLKAHPDGIALKETDLAVRLCGRASLFKPLQDAIQNGVRTFFAGRPAGDVEVKLAIDDARGRSATEDDTIDRAEALKALVCRGALRWARRTIDVRQRMSLQPRLRHIGSFALMTGTWNEERKEFSHITEIFDLQEGEHRYQTKRQDAFIILRPALLSDVDLLKSFMDPQHPFRQRLIGRIIRPIVIDQNPGTSCLPQPLERPCAIDDIRLPLVANTILGWTTYSGNALDLQFQSLGEPPQAPVTLRVESTFADL